MHRYTNPKPYKSLYGESMEALVRKRWNPGFESGNEFVCISLFTYMICLANPIHRTADFSMQRGQSCVGCS